MIDAVEPPSVFNLERPSPKLLAYYVFSSLLLGPFFFLALVPRYFRYYTLRYRFDEEGVSVRWGILFRREISLTYSRIQDIHLASNVFERWLGLARVQVQTASGAAEAEMTIEGMEEYELVRDFLYSRMRGVGPRPHGAWTAAGGAREVSLPDRATTSSPDLATTDRTAELTQVLRQVAEELRAVRQLLAGAPLSSLDQPSEDAGRDG